MLNRFSVFLTASVAEEENDCAFLLGEFKEFDEAPDELETASPSCEESPEEVAFDEAPEADPASRACPPTPNAPPKTPAPRAATTATPTAQAAIGAIRRELPPGSFFAAEEASLRESFSLGRGGRTPEASSGAAALASDAGTASAAGGTGTAGLPTPQEIKARAISAALWKRPLGSNEQAFSTTAFTFAGMPSARSSAPSKSSASGRTPVSA